MPTHGDTRANHALWLGPLVALFGFLSYYTIFYRWPALRDVPWLNLTLLTVGLGVSVLGLRRAWPRGGGRAIAGAAGTLLSIFLAALFVWYVFSYSYELPDRSVALAVGERIPAGTLLDQTGTPVQLAAVADGPRGDGEAVVERRVILVFYRGYW